MPLLRRADSVERAGQRSTEETPARDAALRRYASHLPQSSMLPTVQVLSTHMYTRDPKQRAIRTPVPSLRGRLCLHKRGPRRHRGDTERRLAAEGQRAGGEEPRGAEFGTAVARVAV